MNRVKSAFVKYLLSSIIVAICFFTALIGAAYTSKPVAQFLSRHPHTMEIGTETTGRTDAPNCTVLRLTFRPREDLASFQVKVRFFDEINSAIVQTHFAQGKYQETHGSFEFINPCGVQSRDNGPNGQLAFAQSEDSHTVMAFGQNITPSQEQTFIGALLRTTPGKVTDMDFTGSATYERFGHALPARIVVVDAETGGRRIISDDAP